MIALRKIKFEAKKKRNEKAASWASAGRKAVRNIRIQTAGQMGEPLQCAGCNRGLPGSIRDLRKTEKGIRVEIQTLK